MDNLKALYEAQETAWQAVKAAGLRDDNLSIEGKIKLDIARSRYGKARALYDAAIREEAIAQENISDQEYDSNVIRIADVMSGAV